MGRNIFKLTKIFYDAIVMLILRRHQNATAKKVVGFRGFLLNISKTVQLIFTRLRSCLGNQVSVKSVSNQFHVIILSLPT